MEVAGLCSSCNALHTTATYGMDGHNVDHTGENDSHKLYPFECPLGVGEPLYETAGCPKNQYGS